MTLLKRAAEWAYGVYPDNGRGYTVRLRRDLWVTLRNEFTAEMRVLTDWPPDFVQIGNVRFIPRREAA